MRGSVAHPHTGPMNNAGFGVFARDIELEFVPKVSISPFPLKSRGLVADAHHFQIARIPILDVGVNDLVIRT